MPKIIAFVFVLLSFRTTAQNVGIGTSVPQKPLHVLVNDAAATLRVETAGPLAWYADLELKTSSTLFDQLEFRKYSNASSGTIAGINVAGLSMITAGAGANAGLLVGTIPNYPLYFTTDNTERLRIHADGRMTINTAGISAPNTYQLQVNGGSRGAAMFMENPIVAANQTVSIGRGVSAFRFLETSALNVIASGDRSIITESDTREGIFAITGSNVSAAGRFSGAGSAKLSVELSGFMKVSGTDKTAFVHKAIAANSTAHITQLSYANQQQTDILIVTPNYNPSGGPSAYNNHPIGVYWTGSNWTIFNQDLANIVNTSYNVMVIKQ